MSSSSSNASEVGLVVVVIGVAVGVIHLDYYVFIFEVARSGCEFICFHIHLLCVSILHLTDGLITVRLALSRSVEAAQRLVSISLRVLAGSIFAYGKFFLSCLTCWQA